MNTFIVLVRGLNIRAHNRITLRDQLRVLKACPELSNVRHAGDKGSHLISTREHASKALHTVLSALQTQCLTVTEAAVCQPLEIQNALRALTEFLSDRYAEHFSKDDFGLKLERGNWRAGLAVPIYPHKMPRVLLPLHKTKNALIVGATDAVVLVAKREAHNVPWGTVVTDPSERQIKRISNTSIRLTSRSANIMNELLSYAS